MQTAPTKYGYVDTLCRCGDSVHVHELDPRTREATGRCHGGHWDRTDPLGPVWQANTCRCRRFTDPAAPPELFSDVDGPYQHE